MNVDIGSINVIGSEKRDHFALFRIFHFKTLTCVYLWKHSSYELKLWHEYSSIILLYSQGIPSPAHVRYGQGMRPCRSHSKIAILYMYLALAAHRSGQKLCYSCLEYSCNKYCNLIGHTGASNQHRNLQVY